MIHPIPCSSVASRRLWVAALLSLGLVSGAEAQTAPPLPPEGRPLWELGVAGVSGWSPIYPASSIEEFNVLPVPWAIYRGERLRLDEDRGARFVPLETERYQLTLSGGAAFGSSDSEGVREGLPDLDFLGEVGPQLILYGPRFGPGEDAGRLELQLQARATFAIAPADLRFAYVGSILESRFTYRKPDIFGPGTRLRLSISPQWATEGLQDYFYEVEDRFARPGRPAFDASGGYLGTEASLSLAWRASDRVFLFGSLQAGYWDGAANDDSPLWEEALTGSVFVGFAWSLVRSERLVRRQF